MKTLLYPAILLVAIAGCATKWTRPGTSETTFYKDSSDCELQAANAYPPVMVQRMTAPAVQSTQQRPVQTNCTVAFGGQINCTSRPTGADASIYNRPASYVTEDASAGQRSAAARSCLLAKGYRTQ